MYVTPDDTLYVVDYNVKKGVFVGSAKDGSVKYKLDDAVAEGVARRQRRQHLRRRDGPGHDASLGSRAATLLENSNA